MSSAFPAPAAPPRKFAALRHRGFRFFLGTYVLSMMADNIEHVISYWMMFQKFHSPALGGFAVLSHWLPFLAFSVPVGALADRFDPRRIIQCGMGLFITASLGWGWFFITDSLQMWHAMLLLVIHGCAGVLWQTSSQLLLHDIVPTSELQSAVRLNATARYLGILVGPAVGGAIMLTLGPAHGILLNTLFYLPLVVWLWKAPYGPRFRQGAPAFRRAVRGLADITQTIRDIASLPMIVSMTLLAGAASFFIGDPGTAYSMLLAADAAGALIAGIVLESSGWLRASPRTALMLAIVWCAALASFAMTHHYLVALPLLFVAGFFELSFSSMAQTLVQINAPAEMRGRVIGLFNMSALGLRAFSGVTVGLVGTLVGIHVSLAGSALALLALVAWLLMRKPRVAPSTA
jgi:MFS family permease